jgi:hypothetical protein
LSALPAYAEGTDSTPIHAVTMNTYIVRRRAVAADAHELDEALMRLRAFEDQPFLPVRWLHSYALREADGRFGLVCAFQADSAAALGEHATATRLPIEDIRPVVETRIGRDMAPTLVYLIRRRRAWDRASDVDRRAAEARRVADEALPDRVVWLRSYVVREPDGSFGSHCLYQATDAGALEEHALRAGIPADEIAPVLGRVVFRDESRSTPTQAASA